MKIADELTKVANEAIPGNKIGEAASWLAEQKPKLSEVAANGETCLFWYTVGLLAAYKHHEEET